MIARLGLGLDWNSLLEHHGTAVRVVILAGIFASGFFDAAFFKKKDWACATWFIGLAALTAWIAYSWTTAAFLAGAVVFASGLILLIVYYRRGKTDARKQTR